MGGLMIAYSAAADIHADVEAEERERLKRIDEAWQAYHGDLPPPLKIKRFNDNVTPNFAQVAVDLGASFLFGKDLPFEVALPPAPDGTAGKTEELKESPEEAWLDKAWLANDKGATLLKLALNGGVCGHTFVKIRPKNARTAPFPRLIVLDPASIRPYWDGDDIDDVYKYVQSWREVNKAGKAVARRQVTERADNGLYWMITDQEAPANSVEREKDWRTLGTPERWLYPFSPIEHCQNLPAPNEFWGLSDLEAHIIDLQRAVNFLLSNLQKTIRLFAHPKAYAVGVDANLVTADPDRIEGLPKEADLRYLQAEPFQEPSIALYERLRSALHEVAKVPEVATGKVENIGQLSGLALQILYGPLLAKTGMKRALYGPMLSRINRALLALGGFGDNREVMCLWPDPLPQNTMEQRQVALLDEQLGVSKDTLITKLGYDAEAEAEKKSKERDEAMERAAQAFDRGQGAFGQTGGQQDGNGTQAGRSEE
jgi:hypothetical protein